MIIVVVIVVVIWVVVSEFIFPQMVTLQVLILVREAKLIHF